MFDWNYYFDDPCPGWVTTVAAFAGILIGVIMIASPNLFLAGIFALCILGAVVIVVLLIVQHIKEKKRKQEKYQ